MQLAVLFFSDLDKKVSFNLLSSATRLLDKAGDSMDKDDDFTELAPLVSSIKFGKSEIQNIEATISSRLTEIGTLELSVNATKTDHSWPLHFDLRDISDAIEGEALVTVEQGLIDQVFELFENAFKNDSSKLKTLIKDMENTLSFKKDEWSLSLLRKFADKLIDLSEVCKTSPRHESRWLNTLGFCL